MQVSPDVWEIKEEFAPQEGDLVVYKQRASAFYGTPLIAQLNQMDVNSLIVCGESTSGCVRASAVDAYSNGIHVTIGVIWLISLWLYSFRGGVTAERALDVEIAGLYPRGHGLPATPAR